MNRSTQSWITVMFGALFLMPCHVYAQTPLPGLDGPVEVAETPMSGLMDGKMGFGQVNEDWFVTINVGTALRWGQLGLGIQAPLRIRVVDEEPTNEGTIRKEDWDEISDWTRVLRYLEWGTPNNPDPIYGRLGVLSGISLGHGTIVDRYYNVIDADHYQTGLLLKVDLGVAGGSVFLDNLVDPEIMGLRGTIRPLTFFGFGDFFDRFTVGVTLVGDFVAPRKAKIDPATQERQINGDGDLIVDTEPLWLVGLDLGWKVVETDAFALTPYTDFNVMGATGGYGFHAGVLTTIQAGSMLSIGGRMEYRAVTEDYAPNYINSWYEIERVDYLDSPDDAHDEVVPKLDYFVRRGDAGYDAVRHGVNMTADMTLFKAITISGTYEDYQGPDNSNLMVRLLLPWIADFKFSAYYAKRNFDSFSEAFDLDGGLLVADAKWKAYGPMFVFARYSREWHLNKDVDADNYGHYETINDYDFGIGAEFTF
jgi:hypothetical protein